MDFIYNKELTALESYITPTKRSGAQPLVETENR